MDENKTSAAAAPRAVDPAARARDQLGSLFLVLSIVLAWGAVAARQDPYRVYYRHDVWWWVGWALLMYSPALIFALVPWTMRTVFAIPPRGAAEDATRAFYRLVGFAAALAIVDGIMIPVLNFSPVEEPFSGILLILVAPLVVTPAVLLRFGGRQFWLLVLLPFAVFLHALLLAWAAGFGLGLPVVLT